VHDSTKGLASLKERFDQVLVDAPCTGTGTWRRRPDTKWRLTDRNLQERMAQQQEALTEASTFVRTSGSLLYVTCSVLPEENDRQVQAFCEANPSFEIVPVLEDWTRLFGASAPKPRSADGKTVTLSPASMDTDGFFFCRMRRRPT
jgi:16S rRNA (cytosine967-C5)-methyltransferase